MFVVGVGQSQTTVSQPINFSSYNQSMFGALGNFSLNIEQGLPPGGFNIPYVGTPNLGGISDQGTFGQYGFEIKGSIGPGNVGLNFYSRNWSTGTVDVDYPIHVNYTYPSNYTFEKGQPITINTNYTVDGNAQLLTHFPQAGNVGMDLHFDIGLMMQLQMCFYDCFVAGFDIHPSFDINLFDIDQNRARYLCPDNFPSSMYCEQALLPVPLPDNDYGFEGELDLPYVETTSSIGTGVNDKCLYASGRDQYAWLTLEIFQLIGSMNIPYVSAVLGNLSGGDCFFGGMACYDYSLFSTKLVDSCFTNQDFSFCPDVYTTLKFPVPVQYTVTNPASGNSLVSGPAQSNSIRFKVGNDLNFTYPCNYEFMEVKPKVDISKSGKNFSNHTYDENEVSLWMEALRFEVTVQGFSFTGPWIPRICVVGHPCNCSGSWPWEWRCDWCCDLYAGCDCYWPVIDIGPWSIGYGPVWTDQFPIATLPGIPWFNDSWNLPGFTEKTGSPFTLYPNPYFATTISQSDVNCFEGNDGSFSVQVTNGDPPYNYQWSDGTSTVTNATTATNSNFEAGNQYVVVNNVYGCQALADASIHQPPNPLSIIEETIVDVDCNGNSTGSISISVSGGNGGYSYSWSPNVGSSNQLANIAAGTYQLTISDSKGCTLNKTFVVNEPAPLTAYVNKTDVNCNSGVDGVAKVYASGGNYPFTYLWSNGSTYQEVTNFPAGNHFVVVTDAKGCTFTVNFTVGQPAQPISLSSIITDVKCFNGNDGAVDVTVSGGTAPYSYIWTNSFPLQMAYTTEDIVNVVAEGYTIKVTDANGCVEELLSEVNQPISALSSEIVVSNVNCNGGSDGGIDLSVSGGTLPYNYLWSNGVTMQNNNGIGEGYYTVTTTDANGCTLSDQITVSEPTSPLATIIVSTNVNCFNGMDGTIDLTVTGGTEPYNYIWSNSAASQDISSLTALTYNVLVTDANGCTINDSRVITQPSAPINISGNIIDVACNGGNDGSISAIIVGGTPKYFLQWNNDQMVVMSDTTTSPISLYSGIYTLKVTDQNGCTESKNFTVNEPANPLQSSMSATEVLCFNGTNSSVNLTVTGGTIPYSYLWNNGAITQDLNGVGIGWKVVEVSDNNGCFILDSIQVVGPSSAVSATTESLNVKCTGGNDGYAEVFASGGVYPYTFLWSNGVANPINSNLSAGNYSVAVTDAKGCVANSGVTILEPNNSVAISSVMDSVSCKGFEDGKITINASEGTMPYQVFFGDSTYSQLNTVNGYVADNLPAGTYHIRVVDANGCDATISVVVLEPDTISFEIYTTPVTCYDGTDGNAFLTVQGGTPAYQFFWSNATFNQDMTNVPAGNYSVAISDANNCIVRAETTVDQPKQIIVEANVYQTSCIDAEDGSIEIFVRGGVGDYSYLWSNNELTSDIYNLAGGEYVVQVTDENNCVKMDTFYVNVTQIECINPPTAFTPDGDGYNDTWVLDKMDLYPNAMVQIYNKWGQLLYETKGAYVPWNGEYKGNVLPAATYYYVIDLGNGTPAYTGVVTIVKSKN